MRYRALIAVLGACAFARADEPSPSAFRFEHDKRVKATIDIREVHPGNPNTKKRRDLIPAIFNPEHVAADRVNWLRGGQRVLGIVVNGEARAYPLFVLEGHEMVNDVVGGVPVGPNY